MVVTSDITELIDKKFTTKVEGLRSNSPKFIVLHSTEKNSTFESLYTLHANIYQWNGVGYHVFVSNGKAYKARDYNLEGAHCVGLNFNSIGLCVYSQNNYASNIDLSLAKSIIKDIRKEYGELPVISHTRAQIRYISRLSSQKHIEIETSDIEELRTELEFLAIKEYFNSIADDNKLNNHPYLRKNMYRLNNCPGPGFFEFISALNQTNNTK